MSRKAEIQAVETAVDSPLRRSSRNVNVNSPAPAALNAKKNLQTQIENTEVKGPKTRRASLLQENSEQKETKPTTRGRRASTTKEETEPKAEPAKTRSRRSSAATEPASEEEKKPQTVTRRRRSSATEDTQDTATVKPVRTRRGSSAEKTLEDELVKKPTRTRKTKDEHKEEPVKKTTRTRRGSVDKQEDSDSKEKKPVTRGRRSSTDGLESEPESKAVKLTPIKSRRRLSVTENIVGLEPIKELESEIKIRNSSSPVIKQPILNLTPVDSEPIQNLNLSVINESSFSEEIRGEEDRHDNSAGTPRRSPRLNNSKSTEKLSSPKTGKIDMDSKEQDKDILDKNEASVETGNEIEQFSQTSPKTSKSKSNAENEVKDKVSPPPVDTVTTKQDQLKNTEITELEEKDNSGTVTEVESCSLGIGDVSTTTVSSTQNEVVPENEDLNSSKSSTSSDKENVNTNVVTSPNPKKVIAEEKELVLNTVTNITVENKNIVQQEVVVARVSNVFRPQMKENSFMEPMDVDEYPSMLDCEQDKSQALKIDDVSIVSPHDGNKEEPLNKKLLKESFVDTQNESIDESFHLSLSNEEKNTSKNTIDVCKGEEFPENEEQVKEKKTVDGKIEESNENMPAEEVGNMEQAKEIIVENPVETDKLHVEEIKDEKDSVLENTKSPEDKESISVSVDPLDQDLSFEKSTSEVEEASCTKNEQINVENKLEVNTEENRSRSPSFLIIQRDYKKLNSAKVKLTSQKEMVEEEPLSKFISNETKDHKDSSIQLLQSPKDELTLEKDTELKKSESPQPTTEYPATKSESPETKKYESKPEDRTLRRSKSPKYDTENIKDQDIDINTKPSSQEQVLNIDEKVDGANNSSETLKEEALQETPPKRSKSPERVNLLNDTVQQSQKETVSLKKAEDSLIDPEEDKGKRTTDVNQSTPETESHIQEHEEKQDLHILENTFSKTETPNVKNIKISDIEREIRRRSRSPSFPKESDYSQLSENTLETTLDPIQLKEETEPQSQKKIIEETNEESISVITTDVETSKDLSQVSENTPADSVQLKKDLNLPTQQSVDLEDKHDSSQADSILEEIDQSQFEGTEKSNQPDDYEFKVPSDEEETDEVHVSGYDKSTIVASFITDDSVSMTMQTVILADKKDTGGDGIENKEIIEKNSQRELNIDIEQKMEDHFIDEVQDNNEEYEKTGEEPSSPFLKEKSKKRTSKYNQNLIDGEESSDNKDEENQKKSSPKKKSKKDIFKDDNESEESEENISNTKITKKEKIQNIDIAEPLASVTPKKKSKKRISKHVNEFDNNEGKFDITEMKMDDVQVNNENQKAATGIKSSPPSSEKKPRQRHRKSKEFQRDIEENTDMKSPQKKLKIRKYSLTKEIDSYEESMEKSNEGSEDIEESENDADLPKKKNLKKRTTSVNKDKIEKEYNTNDDIEAEDVKSVKRKSKNLNLKRKTNEDIENLTSPKKKKVSKESTTKKYDDIEKTKRNKKKKETQKNISISEDTSEQEDNMLPKDELDDLMQSIHFDKTSKKKKNKDKSCVKKDEKCEEIVDDSKEKSPSSILVDYVSQKLLELSSEEEFSSDDENPKEPNDFVCTMAEEGEEDTPSEDSNAIIDEGETINSTDTEYGSEDNDFDEDDSFICDDEEEQLLSGEEYDLGDEKTKKKKSRIIQLDDSEEDIIKIQKKEKTPPPKKKRIRIISISESSGSEGNEVDSSKDTNFEEAVRPSKESSEDHEVICVEDKTDEDVFIVEAKPARNSLEASPNVVTNKSSEKRRLSSITIHENIDVKEIKDAALSGRISQIVDSFCTTMNKGEISMNLSIECLIKDDQSADEGKIEKAKSSSSSNVEFIEDEEEDINLEEETSYSPPKRLSVSMSNAGQTKKKEKKKRKLSKSMDHLDQIEPKSKKNKVEKNKKLVEKKKVKSSKRKFTSEDELRAQSFGLLNQLITDLKNRPRRVVRPSTNMNNSWLTEIVDVKPSTSAFDKKEKAAYKAGKVHPKDFRSQMLNDPSRVRRVETKTLLRKKGVYM